MSEPQHALIELVKTDQRYKIDAYLFVRDGLSYAQEVLNMSGSQQAEESEPKSEGPEHHLTGQQLCEALRQYSLNQYGYMAKMVLNNWGIHETGDFGEIVYNMIRIGLMKKSDTDRREDFNNVFEFEEGLQNQFDISMPE